MDTSRGPSGAPEHRLAPRTWGAGLLFGAILCALRFFDTESQGIAAPLGIMTAMIAGAVLAALVFMVNGTTLASVDRFYGHARALTIGATLAALGGCIALAPWYLPEFFLAEAAAIGLATALGAGLGSLLVLWGMLYARLEPEQLLPNGAVAIIIATLAKAAQAALGTGAMAYLFMILVLIVGSGLLLSALPNVGPTEGTDKTDGSPTEPMPTRRASNLRGMLASLWLPLIGAGLACFIFGLIWDPVTSGESARAGTTAPWLSSLTGPALMGAAVALTVMHDRGTSPLRRFNEYVFPLAVAVLLVIPPVSQAQPTWAPLTGACSSASFALIALTAWCALTATARSSNAPATAVFGLGIAWSALTFLGGLYAILIVGEHGRTLCLVALALYLVLIAVSFARASQEERASRIDGPTVDDARSLIRRRCDELTEQFGLSPRENDVLYYLGRGYNHAYIAKKLYISENTVRTHVRHIYTKLDVGSREEIIDLIDEG